MDSPSKPMQPVGAAITVADSQEDTLRSLGFLETEIPDTCKYSPANKPHGPKEIEDAQGRKFQCDGFGYLYSGDGIAYNEKTERIVRCPCWIRHRQRNAIDDYYKAIGRVDAAMVRRIIDHRLYDDYALGTVRRLWKKNTHAVLLSGKAGIGKTIACHVLIYQWLKTDPEATAVFFQAKTLLDDCIAMSSGDWETRNTIAAQWTHRRELADNPRTVWMIDDLGEEVHRSRDGDLAMREMRDLLKRIHHRRGRCAISTNLDGARVVEVYGERFASRVGERNWIWCHDFKATGERMPDARKEAPIVHQPWDELFSDMDRDSD